VPDCLKQVPDCLEQVMSPRLRVPALLLLSSRAGDCSDAATNSFSGRLLFPTNSFSGRFFFRTTNAIAAVDDSVGVVGEGRSSPEDHANAAATFLTDVTTDKKTATKTQDRRHDLRSQNDPSR
jgi:hypothetical protein